MMGTDFNSFDASPFGAFVESPLGVRNGGGFRFVTTRLYTAENPPEEVWTADHGGTVFDVATDAAGNVYTLGQSVSRVVDGEIEVASLRKYSPAGELLWSVDARGNNMDADPAGNVYVAYPLRKYDTDGNLVWEAEKFAGTAFDDAAAAATTYHDGFVYGWGNPAFTIFAFPGFRRDIVVGKFDVADGSLVWQRRLFPGLANGHAFVRDGHLWTSMSLYVARWDLDGNQLWQQSIGGQAQKIVVDSDSVSYVVRAVGSTGAIHRWEAAGSALGEFADLDGIERAAHIDANDETYWADGDGWSKLDTAGEIVWTRPHGDWVREIRQDPDGRFVIGGHRVKESF